MEIQTHDLHLIAAVLIGSVNLMYVVIAKEKWAKFLGCFGFLCALIVIVKCAPLISLT